MVTYDTPAIAAQKAEYIKQNRLGGAMWWETSGDLPASNSDSLIRVVTNGLGGNGLQRLEQLPNVLHYPTSRYQNIRRGMPGE